MMATRLRRTLLVLAALAGVLGAAPRGALAEGLAIVGATVVDGAAAPIPDAVVLIDGDRIQAVGSRAQVALPKGITIVDGLGKWVAPGLVDAHVHFFQSGSAYTRPTSSTSARCAPTSARSRS
jgi:imidazolonepropionase-like amidohydrolase